MVTQAKSQDGLQLLASDHRKVEDLFAAFENASGLKDDALLPHRSEQPDVLRRLR